MPVTALNEIRLLPPLAIGRFGGSPEPMHNYDLVTDDAVGFRRLQPAPTFVVDPASGEIVQSTTPPGVRFRDGAGRIKPVCPFFELWGRFDDAEDLVPFTVRELNDLGLTPAAVRWDVEFGNLKMLRRTGDPGDRIAARIAGISDHVRRPLTARAQHFKAGRTIPLGFVQYIKPTAQFPEIRFRFTPPAGQVFGVAANADIPPANAVYDATAGSWDTHADAALSQNPVDPRARFSTIPPQIYGRNPLTGENLGYFDDSSDGVIVVRMTLPAGQELTSFARVAAGPPHFAPDSLPIRSMEDEFEQLTLGIEVERVDADEVIDIVRRALDTLRLMDTAGLNVRYSESVFTPTVARHGTVVSIHSALIRAIEGLKQPSHTAERQNAHSTLVRIDQMLRDFTESPDRRAGTRRKMPAMMRGADGGDLALTRRQRNIIRKAIEVFAPAPSSEAGEVRALKQMIGALQFAAVLHSGFAEAGRTLADRFAVPDEVIDYLRIAVARGSVATAAGLAGQPLVRPGDPDNSAFLQLVSRSDHPMNGPLSSYSDPETGKSGLLVVRDWIASLS